MTTVYVSSLGTDEYTVDGTADDIQKLTRLFSNLRQITGQIPAR